MSTAPRRREEVWRRRWVAVAVGAVLWAGLPLLFGHRGTHMSDADIHITGGTVVDGTRVPRYQADVWIKDGKITQIGGRATGGAERVIDAAGKIVAPGFVDLHTHYDAQIRWDPWCTISGWHGVTSVVLGNCGFGFVPVKPDFRERSMLTMTASSCSSATSDAMS